AIAPAAAAPQGGQSQPQRFVLFPVLLRLHFFRAALDRRPVGVVRLRRLDRLVHALVRRRRHQRRFAQDQREDLVAGGDLGEVHVGGQRQLFHFGELVGRQFVVEVLGDGVGIDLGAGATRGRRGDA